MNKTTLENKGYPESRQTLWGEEAQRSGRISGQIVPK